MARNKFMAIVTDDNRLRIARRVYEFIMQQASKNDVVRVSLPGRSTQQNAKLWPMLQDISRQIEWYGKYLDEDEWKAIFTAVIKEQDVVPGLRGGFVVVGGSSSGLDKEQFSDLIELMYSFGAEKSVVWSEKANEMLFSWQQEQAARQPKNKETA